MWFDMSVYLVFVLSLISSSDVSVTPLTILLNISVKWHVINTDLLSIVHFPVCLALLFVVMLFCSVLIVCSGCMCGLNVFVFAIVLEYLLMGL